LKVGEVSAPVRSKFGYHLIKVTELVAAETKSYDAVKAELLKLYQKAQSETTFANLAQELAKVSFENGGTLEPSAQLINAKIQTTGLFTQQNGEGIAKEEKVRASAFSDEVLAGQNSEPVELGEDKVVVLRLLDHKPAAVLPLAEVKTKLVAAIHAEQAKKHADEVANQIRDAVLSGQTLEQAAAAQHLTVKKAAGLTRMNTDVSPVLLQAVFRAAKPKAGLPGVAIFDDGNGGKNVLAVLAVSEGALTDADKQKMPMIEQGMGGALGRVQYETLLTALEQQADVKMREEKETAR
jgi:peptidyl-prolyl cis-trans isomerase D